ncbi:MAG: 1-deoxy-D-xylulose-5-phosphate reductoisomerase [Proteobacteria bacterium]|nr:1-deoxy-D-xylulose-5-phosphate reductoisomerase [Pseudomonadota bacterium]
MTQSQITTVVNILGSTGSIGRNTLEVIAANKGIYKVRYLTAYQNAQLLAQQAQQFDAEAVAIIDERQYELCQALLSGTGIAVYTGLEGALELAAKGADVTVSAIVGVAGLAPTLASMPNSKVVALANKESVVCGGHLLRAAEKKYGTMVLPIDSEHCAILQAMADGALEEVDAITITASGGPCRQMNQEQMAGISPEMAVNHPTWRMGPKISVDCATMFNKGLEVIEAYHFFPVLPGKVEVVVHPQSVVHAMVTYRNGSSMAQLSLPDMRVPIAHILGVARKQKLVIPYKRLDLATCGSLTFEAPDFSRFPLLALAMSVASAGQAEKVVINAANEQAVSMFLNGRIGFLEIQRLVQAALDYGFQSGCETLDSVYALHDEVQHYCSSMVV